MGQFSRILIKFAMHVPKCCSKMNIVHIITAFYIEKECFLADYSQSKSKSRYSNRAIICSDTTVRKSPIFGA